MIPTIKTYKDVTYMRGEAGIAVVWLPDGSHFAMGTSPDALVEGFIDQWLQTQERRLNPPGPPPLPSDTFPLSLPGPGPKFACCMFCDHWQCTAETGYHYSDLTVDYGEQTVKCQQGRYDISEDWHTRDLQRLLAKHLNCDDYAPIKDLK
ncbi:MAG: hypothetical protein GY934_13425 [Gammaproteobacteria bacterium]|nr:hypothetical protein [Gammaproteobacteria bacterium]